MVVEDPGILEDPRGNEERGTESFANVTAGRPLQAAVYAAQSLSACMNARSEVLKKSMSKFSDIDIEDASKEARVYVSGKPSFTGKDPTRCLMLDPYRLEEDPKKFVFCKRKVRQRSRERRLFGYFHQDEMSESGVFRMEYIPNV